MYVCFCIFICLTVFVYCCIVHIVQEVCIVNKDHGEPTHNIHTHVTNNTLYIYKS